RSFGWTIQMINQPEVYLQALGVSVLAAIVAAVYPMRRLLHMEVAAALRQEGVMLKRLILFRLLGVIGLSSFWWLTQRPVVNQSPPTLFSANDSDVSGFARALEPQSFTFPRDHGPHFDYQTEWWYYTGNLTTPTGDHFGYQLTFFRRG